MERLTEHKRNDVQIKAAKEEDCGKICEKHVTCDGCPVDDAIRKLAAYEDTGLAPDQIHNQKHNLGIAYNIISGYEQCIREIFKRQQEHNGRQYIDAEEASGIIDKIMSGRLKELRDDINRSKPRDSG
jgi:hypothetical protein